MSHLNVIRSAGEKGLFILRSEGHIITSKTWPLSSVIIICFSQAICKKVFNNNTYYLKMRFQLVIWVVQWKTFPPQWEFYPLFLKRKMVKSPALLLLQIFQEYYVWQGNQITLAVKTKSIRWLYPIWQVISSLSNTIKKDFCEPRKWLGWSNIYLRY